MNEMLEIVAKALWDSEPIIYAWGPQERHFFTWEQAVERNLAGVGIYRQFARASIEAMRCPPKEILELLYRIVDDPETASFDVWNAIIDKMLSSDC